ncbi:tetratricopeptide repeat domain-containing protein [Colletotrichum scovillei]|uniref:Tetratricopeptide repeat domain-containing protein n=1 Tax=Colletotrichum scovillei TaxID=1209932 RepID=A0A9P7QXL6_9PEZI|nr:tetratricopeptide repeat domain-containing protein [Colletotrichum scovillei]KAG7063956.1 tetratricopeptide repeat domain-containing protein [Colletotrichum scovillei]
MNMGQKDDKIGEEAGSRPAEDNKEKVARPRGNIHWLYQDGADIRQLPLTQPFMLQNNIYIRDHASAAKSHSLKESARHRSSYDGTFANNIYVDVPSSSDSENDDYHSFDLTLKGHDTRVGGSGYRLNGSRNSSSQDDIRVLVNPKSPQDVSLRTETAITEDFEEQLEEFSRLWRLGKFQEATTLFDECLKDLVDNPYILEQYGQCLLEKSDYLTLSQLAREFPPEPAEGTVQTSWYLLLQRAKASSELDFPTLSAIEKPGILQLLRKNWPKLDSTEIRVLKNAIYLDDSSLASMSAQDLHQVYLYLKIEGRIWEFRDIFQECLASYGLKDMIRMMFGGKDDRGSKRQADIVQTIVDDWDTPMEDEAVSFALLDIFTTLVLASMAQFDSSRTAIKYFGVAQKHAAHILAQDPQNLKSRPYLRWAVAKVLIGQYTSEKPIGLAALTHRLHRLPGKLRISKRVFPHQNIPIYAPIEDESLDWRPSPTTDSEEDTIVIQTVLKTAENLGDTELQAACIQELIYLSSDPLELLKSLSGIWQKGGNLRRYKQTLLYRYLCVPETPPEIRETLRHEILLSGDFSSAGFSQYSQYMVLRALSSRINEKEAYLKHAQNLQKMLDGDGSASQRMHDTIAPYTSYPKSSYTQRYDSNTRSRQNKQTYVPPFSYVSIDRTTTRERNNKNREEASEQVETGKLKSRAGGGDQRKQPLANPTFGDLPRPRSEMIPSEGTNKAHQLDVPGMGDTVDVVREEKVPERGPFENDEAEKPADQTKPRDKSKHTRVDSEDEIIEIRREEDHETEQALRDGDDGGGGAHLTEDNEYEDGNA